ncbi:hypothetical protein EJ04DRAFT_599723 [Polyplosphaeria fusca]|uniref:Uncharacterized protein n=1 Tax=Polyplosphaeria fusca TaxID=682080 RepID=A0A9P4V4R5_9PLEO|nr:hypothetical protein EJ04DRAFT_599723 [Polyplosphaeria fusca]
MEKCTMSKASYPSARSGLVVLVLVVDVSCGMLHLSCVRAHVPRSLGCSVLAAPRVCYSCVPLYSALFSLASRSLARSLRRWTRQAMGDVKRPSANKLNDQPCCALRAL